MQQEFGQPWYMELEMYASSNAKASSGNHSSHTGEPRRHPKREDNSGMTPRWFESVTGAIEEYGGEPGGSAFRPSAIKRTGYKDAKTAGLSIDNQSRHEQPAGRGHASMLTLRGATYILDCSIPGFLLRQWRIRAQGRGDYLRIYIGPA